MSHSQKYQSHSALGRAMTHFEETAIAVLLGLMTMLTFINVVLRYGFGTGIFWAAEAVVILFAWLVVFGISYCVKITAHLGVDAMTNLLPVTARRAVALFAAVCCLFYALLLLKGGWDYWANFANLPQTSGRWIPSGFQEMKPTSYRGWYVTETLPFPQFLSFIEGVMNEGEAYEKLPRFIPYVILPVGFALLVYRFVQVLVRIWNGDSGALIVSHEAEDAIEVLAAERAARGE